MKAAPIPGEKERKVSSTKKNGAEGGLIIQGVREEKT